MIIWQLLIFWATLQTILRVCFFISSVLLFYKNFLCDCAVVVDGGWSDWSHLDVCSAEPCSHEIGFRIRFRSCTSPTPMFGGVPCQGRSWKRETCYNNDFCTMPGNTSFPLMRFKSRFSAVLQIFVVDPEGCAVVPCGRSRKVYRLRFDCGQYGSVTVFAVYLQFLCGCRTTENRCLSRIWESGITCSCSAFIIHSFCDSFSALRVRWWVAAGFVCRL